MPRPRLSPGERTPSIHCTSRHGSVVVGVLATGTKGCRFDPGQGNRLLRAIIHSTSSFWMGNKAGGPMTKDFAACKRTLVSPMGMARLNSHFLRSSPTHSRDVSGDVQSTLVDKLGVSPSRSHLPRSTLLSSGDRTIGPGLQF
jgi:hypothetical protein